jgi:Na+/H+-dicarboxylate symporter
MTTSIRSTAGAYLWATATNSPAETIPGDAARTVFARAFGLAVRLRFQPGTPLTAIAATVRKAARRHPALTVPVREAEMLIRQALDEQVPTAGIPPAAVVTVQVLLFAALVDELALTDDELAELIADAEAV